MDRVQVYVLELGQARASDLVDDLGVEEGELCRWSGHGVTRDNAVRLLGRCGGRGKVAPVWGRRSTDASGFAKWHRVSDVGFARPGLRSSGHGSMSAKFMRLAHSRGCSRTRSRRDLTAMPAPRRAATRWRLGSVAASSQTGAYGHIYCMKKSVFRSALESDAERLPRSNWRGLAPERTTNQVSPGQLAGELHIPTHAWPR